MRTLLIHQAFVSPNEAGGTRHYELARHLLNAGDDFAIVASDLSYLSGKRTVEGRRLVTKQTVDGIDVLRAYTYPSLHRSFFWRIVTFLSFMLTSVIAGLRAGKVDVVMGTSPPIFQAFSAWLIAFLRRRPFLLEIRDLWPEFAIDMGVLTNPLLIKLSKTLEQFLYNRADHLLVNSPAYRDYLIEKKGVASHKVSLIPNGVDTSMFDPTATGDEIRAEHHLQNKFVVTYAGALGMANDISTILRAAKQLQADTDIHFLIVGDGKERQNLEREMRELGVSNVTFAGSRPKHLMPSYLAASDACTATLQNIPMFKTTYPNKVFDYMAAGRPTILAIDGVIREVVESANGGIFVQPSDDNAFAEAVLRLKCQPEKAQQMGKSARQYVEQHFERNGQAVQFVRLLENMGQL